MSTLTDDLKQLGLRLACAEIEARKGHDVECVFIGQKGLSNALIGGMEPIFQFLLSHDIDVVLVKDDVWLEVRKLSSKKFQFEIQQGWPGSGSVTRTVTWRPSHRVSMRRVLGQRILDYRSLAPGFCKRFGVGAPYVAGAMAGGIASVKLVRSLSRVGILSFFGSGGLPLQTVANALADLSVETGVWGCNLLHNPSEPKVEEQTVDLFLQYGVSRISASAYMRLSNALVRYRLLGLSERDGKVYSAHQIFAKVSHPSVVQQFLSPAPAKIVDGFLKEGVISETQARLARRIPMADAITVEGDSGGHTDSRPLSVLLPSVLQLRDQAMKEYG